jgi:thioredoxin 1
MVEDVNSNELAQLIGDNKVVFVDCHADWCQPCKILGPILEELDEKFQEKGLKVVKIDVDQNRERTCIQRRQTCRV